MTRDFQDRGLIVDQDVSHYDGTTAVVRSEHLSADDIEFLRWRADRWMKVGHMPAALAHSPLFVLRNSAQDAVPHLRRQHPALGARARGRTGGLCPLPRSAASTERAAYRGAGR